MTGEEEHDGKRECRDMKGWTGITQELPPAMLHNLCNSYITQAPPSTELYGYYSLSCYAGIHLLGCINVAGQSGRAYLNARTGPQYIRRLRLPTVILSLFSEQDKQLKS